MSTFGGLISEIDGVSVDRFESQNLTCRVYFLSHCHTDHYAGIDSNDFLKHVERHNYNIYTSEISCIIITSKYPKLKKFVKSLRVGEIHNITELDGEVDVTLIPAGHCPGSVMFLFSTLDKTILYTGDFRIDPEDLQNIFRCRKKPLTIDKLYFDSTFWNEEYSYFPSRGESCKAVCAIAENWLRKDNCNIVNLVVPACIGAENLYIDIYNNMKMPICINAEYLVLAFRQVANLRNVLTLDKNKSRIFTNWKMILNSRVCNIKISAMRWKRINKDDQIYSENKDIYYVCYSNHCSFDELKKVLEFLKPKDLEPCVVNENSLQIYNSLNKFCKDFLLNPLSDINYETKLVSTPQKRAINYMPCSFYDDSDSEEDVTAKVPKIV